MELEERLGTDNFRHTRPGMTERLGKKSKEEYLGYYNLHTGMIFRQNISKKRLAGMLLGRHMDQDLPKFKQDANFLGKTFAVITNLDKFVEIKREIEKVFDRCEIYYLPYGRYFYVSNRSGDIYWRRRSKCD